MVLIDVNGECRSRASRGVQGAGLAELFLSRVRLLDGDGRQQAE